MPSQAVSLAIFLILLLVLIIITEQLHKKLKWPAEQSRKFLHVSGGLMCLTFPLFISSHWWLLPLAAISFGILLFTYKKRLLPSVHRTKRFSAGSVIFPVPVYGCFVAADLLDDPMLFYLPVALLTIADTSAEMAGNRWGHLSKQFFGGQKTLAGSLSFFLAAIVINLVILHFIFHWSIADVIVIGTAIALAATLAELVTLYGWDNLTVPAVVLLILLLTTRH